MNDASPKPLRWPFTGLALLLAGFVPGQSIDWQPVSIKAPDGQSIKAARGVLEVPEDRANPDGSQVQLQLGRLKGTGNGPPIFYLHGGPGGSATRSVQSGAMMRTWQTLLAEGDVILIDQRGGGLSKPSLDLRVPDAPPGDFLSSRKSLERWLAKATLDHVANLRKRGIHPEAFHNLANVEDIDAVREALGVDKIRLFGFSFGSHLGLAYMRTHPDAVDRAVLLGIEGPDQTRKLPETFDVHWHKLMLRAAKDPELAEHKDKLADLLPRALAKLTREPLTVIVRDRVDGKQHKYRIGAFGLQFLVMIDLGDSRDIPILPRLVHEVANGKTHLITSVLAKRITMLRNLPGVMFTMDAGAGASAARNAAIREQASRSLFANAMNLDYPTVEAIWKPRQLGAGYRSPVVSDIPTLFVSGELDSNTPPYQAELVRWGFCDSVHLVAANAGHEASWIANQPTADAAAAFFAGKDVRHHNIDLPPIRFAALEGKTAVSHPALR